MGEDTDRQELKRYPFGEEVSENKRYEGYKVAKGKGKEDE